MQRTLILLLLTVTAWAAATATAAAAASPTVPRGFDDRVVKADFSLPVAVRFAADGTAFVAEKSGAVKRFASPDNPAEPSKLVADVRSAAYSWGDRGMLGLAIDPDYGPARPYIYIAYTYSSQRGGTSDCENVEQGCVASGRISRIDTSKPATGDDGNASNETVLVEDYCVQFNSHTVGDLAFGPDGQLYASAGEGASTAFADRGQVGNPCGDPEGEGGAFRAQDLRTEGDPLGLSGTIIRLDPNANTKLRESQYRARIIALGLRNPFRIDFRPGTSEIWVADVGWNNWEEINRVLPGRQSNFGWPCYEGASRALEYAAFNGAICNGLYEEDSALDPYMAYARTGPLYPGDRCPVGRRASLSAMRFYDGATFPAEYRGALFVSEYMRSCTWAVPPGADGLPDLGRAITFSTGLRTTDLQVGPAGDLYYTTIDRSSGKGDLRRVRWIGQAKITAAPARGPVALDVRFDGSGSALRDGPLQYAWDLDNDGQFDDGTTPQVGYRFATPGEQTVRLRVSNATGFSDIDTITVRVDGPPAATIEAPAEGDEVTTGEKTTFRGSARSGIDGSPLPASRLAWRLERCTAAGCEELRRFTGTAGDSFVGPRPRTGATWLMLRLTATDHNGLVSTVARRLTLLPAKSRLSLQGAERNARGELAFDGHNDTATYSTKGLRLANGFTLSARVRAARRGVSPAPLLIGQRKRGRPAFEIRAARAGVTRWLPGRLRSIARVRAGRWSRVRFDWDGKTAKLRVDKRVIRRTFKGSALRRVNRRLARVQHVRIGGDRVAKRWFRGTVAGFSLRERRARPVGSRR